MAFLYHPDKNPGDATAPDRFRQITAAYDVLTGRAAGTTGHTAAPDDIFYNLDKQVLDSCAQGAVDGIYAAFVMFVNVAARRAGHLATGGDSDLNIQIAQLQKTLVDIEKLRRFAKVSCYAALGCIWFMVIYNLLDGHTNALPGLIFYPASGICMCAAAICRDMAEKRVKNSHELIRSVHTKVL